MLLGTWYPLKTRLNVRHQLFPVILVLLSKRCSAKIKHPAQLIYFNNHVLPVSQTCNLKSKTVPNLNLSSADKLRTVNVWIAATTRNAICTSSQRRENFTNCINKLQCFCLTDKYIRLWVTVIYCIKLS